MVGAGVLNLKMSADQNEDGWLVRTSLSCSLELETSIWGGRLTAEQQLFSEFIPPT